MTSGQYQQLKDYFPEQYIQAYANKTCKFGQHNVVYITLSISCTGKTIYTLLFLCNKDGTQKIQRVVLVNETQLSNIVAKWLAETN